MLLWLLHCLTFAFCNFFFFSFFLGTQAYLCQAGRALSLDLRVEGKWSGGFGIQPYISSSFLLTLAHVATQSNDNETVKFFRDPFRTFREFGRPSVTISVLPMVELGLWNAGREVLVSCYFCTLYN
jgi:hypothetical protein